MFDKNICPICGEKTVYHNYKGEQHFNCITGIEPFHSYLFTKYGSDDDGYVTIKYTNYFITMAFHSKTYQIFHNKQPGEAIFLCREELPVFKNEEELLEFIKNYEILS